jgi:hypothetical protein
VTVRITERGRANYYLVRREWAKAVATAADDDATNLDAALQQPVRFQNSAGLRDLRFSGCGFVLVDEDAEDWSTPVGFQNPVTAADLRI